MESFECPPVMICGFNRPECLREVFESVRRAHPAQLFLVLDAPRDGRPLHWDVYPMAVNGANWSKAIFQIDQLGRTKPERIDLILVMLGTNDYAKGVPIGDWYETELGSVKWGNTQMTLPHRNFNTDTNTLCGCINVVMSVLRKKYPKTQIVLLTMPHRAYFQWSDEHVQPAQDWPNASGVFVEEYVQCVKDAGSVWSCPVLDVYGESGLLPEIDGGAELFKHPQNDGLHPNARGHYRIAEYVYAKLIGIPRWGYQ